MAVNQKAGIGSLVLVIIMGIAAWSVFSDGNGGTSNKAPAKDARRVQFTVVYEADKTGPIKGLYSYGFGKIPFNDETGSWRSKKFWVGKGQLVSLTAVSVDQKRGRVTGWIKNLTTGNLIDTCQNFTVKNGVTSTAAGGILCEGATD
jgi:hypothetical protein